ncbi:MAG: metalloregulator ArsR/SmtB family transcription factor [Anaerolineales bacterium]|nr:metalloregulator ArsR/SmtB family transcription factor [Anaerolineales bacterium]
MEGYVAAGDLLKACGHPVRLRILEVLLQDGEACVCHLEAQLGQRQAAMSQHLSRLRQAGLVTDRRDGWNVYYSVAESSLAPLLAAARRTADGVARSNGRRLTFQAPSRRSGKACPCPRCGETVAEPAAG